MEILMKTNQLVARNSRRQTLYQLSYTFTFAINLDNPGSFWVITARGNKFVWGQGMGAPGNLVNRGSCELTGTASAVEFLVLLAGSILVILVHASLLRAYYGYCIYMPMMVLASSFYPAILSTVTG